MNQPAPLYQSDLLVILERIVEQESPDELPIVKQIGPELVTQTSAGGNSTGGFRGISFEFGGAVEMGILGIHLIVGTVALIEGYLKSKHIREAVEFERKFQDDWVRYLVDAGMEADLARQIPVRYGPEMLQFLKKYRSNAER